MLFKIEKKKPAETKQYNEWVKVNTGKLIAQHSLNKLKSTITNSEELAAILKNLLAKDAEEYIEYITNDNMDIRILALILNEPDKLFPTWNAKQKMRLNQLVHAQLVDVINELTIKR